MTHGDELLRPWSWEFCWLRAGAAANNTGQQYFFLTTHKKTVGNSRCGTVMLRMSCRQFEDVAEGIYIYTVYSSMKFSNLKSEFSIRHTVLDGCLYCLKFTSDKFFLYKTSIFNNFQLYMWYTRLFPTQTVPDRKMHKSQKWFFSIICLPKKGLRLIKQAGFQLRLEIEVYWTDK